MTNITLFGINQAIIYNLLTNDLISNTCISEYVKKVQYHEDEVVRIYSDIENSEINPIFLSQNPKLIYESAISLIEENVVIVVFFTPSKKHKVEKYYLNNSHDKKLIELGTNVEVKSILAQENKIFFCQKDRDFKIGLISLSDSKVIYFQGHVNYINDISVSYENKIFASVSEDRTIKLWDIRDKKCIETIYVQSNTESIILSGHLNSLKVIGWGGDSGLWIWNFKNKCFSFKKDGIYLTIVRNFKISNDEKILTGDPSGFIECFSIKQNKYLWSSFIANTWIYTIEICPIKNLVIVSGEDGTIHILDMNTGKLIKKLIAHEGGIWNIICLNNVLITSGFDETIRIWNLDDYTCYAIFTGHTHKITHMFISSNKKYLVSCDKRGNIFSWKADWNNLFK